MSDMSRGPAQKNIYITYNFTSTMISAIKVVNQELLLAACYFQ